MKKILGYGMMIGGFVLLAANLVLIVRDDVGKSRPRENAAIGFIHMIVKDAECTSLHQGDLIDTALCKTPQAIFYCEGHRLGPPSCQQVVNLAPPQNAAQPNPGAH